MEHKMYDYSITASGVKIDEWKIKSGLKCLGLENILVESLLNFEATVENFPDEEIPGLAGACVKWMNRLGANIGELSEEKEKYMSDNPRIFAKVMHKQICSYGKTSLASATLVCECVSDVLNQLRGE